MGNDWMFMHTPPEDEWAVGMSIDPDDDGEADADASDAAVVAQLPRSEVTANLGRDHTDLVAAATGKTARSRGDGSSSGSGGVGRDGAEAPRLSSIQDAWPSTRSGLVARSAGGSGGSGAAAAAGTSVSGRPGVGNAAARDAAIDAVAAAQVLGKGATAAGGMTRVQRAQHARVVAELKALVQHEVRQPCPRMCGAVFGFNGRLAVFSNVLR